MSRMKDPPKEICMARTVKGKWMRCLGDPKMAEDLGLKVVYYNLEDEKLPKKPNTKPKTKKKPKKTIETNPAETAQDENEGKSGQAEPDKPAQQADGAANDTPDNASKALWYCGTPDCGKDIYNLLTDDKQKSLMCPHCGSRNIKTK